MKQAIENLIQFEINHGIIDNRDRVYVRNQIYSLIGIEPPLDVLKPLPINHPSDALNVILDEMEKNNLISQSIVERDLFDSRIMNVFTSLPSQVQYNFDTLYKENKTLATNWYYNYVKSINYIRYDRILKNESFAVETNYGKLQITINLSKPEKDPKSIILAGKTASSEYPKCLLCLENEGFSGNIKRDSRHQHRIIKLNLNRENWYFQYSPYIYYPEHTIVFSESHRPMKINQDTFKNLLNLVARFPGYFFGSNADLPIVGGSILSHDHYQGGKHNFPIESASVLQSYQKDDVELHILNWPLSTIRLISPKMKSLYTLANKVLNAWKNYSNPALNLSPETDGIPHHTLTPIARKYKENYVLDLILRNNQTSSEHHLGIYHPHADKWHIKKENIGLIEAIGLAILPPRLKSELAELKDHILHQKPLTRNSIKHQSWAIYLMKKHSFTVQNFDQIINQEIGLVFAQVLEDCGVFKLNETGINAFKTFIEKDIL